MSLQASETYLLKQGCVGPLVRKVLCCWVGIILFCIALHVVKSAKGGCFTKDTLLTEQSFPIFGGTKWRILPNSSKKERAAANCTYTSWGSYSLFPTWGQRFLFSLQIPESLVSGTLTASSWDKNILRSQQFLPPPPELFGRDLLCSCFGWIKKLMLNAGAHVTVVTEQW